MTEMGDTEEKRLTSGSWLRTQPAFARRTDLGASSSPLREQMSGRDPAGAGDAPHDLQAHQRMHALVGEYLDFVWRSLRRLGVAESDCDDGCQRVWLVVTRKLSTIRRGKERSFIFSVVPETAPRSARNGRGV